MPSAPTLLAVSGLCRSVGFLQIRHHKKHRGVPSGRGRVWVVFAGPSSEVLVAVQTPKSAVEHRDHGHLVVDDLLELVDDLLLLVLVGCRAELGEKLVSLVGLVAFEVGAGGGADRGGEFAVEQVVEVLVQAAGAARRRRRSDRSHRCSGPACRRPAAAGSV